MINNATVPLVNIHQVVKDHPERCAVPHKSGVSDVAVAALLSKLQAMTNMHFSQLNALNTRYRIV